LGIMSSQFSLIHCLRNGSLILDAIVTCRAGCVNKGGLTTCVLDPLLDNFDFDVLVSIY
jgi:hypothetical protein